MGPGGHFMTHDHTYRYMRDAQWRPTILNRYGREKWDQEGALDLAQRANKKARHLLETHEVPELSPGVAGKVGELVAMFVGGEG